MKYFLILKGKLKIKKSSKKLLLLRLINLSIRSSAIFTLLL